MCSWGVYVVIIIFLFLVCFKNFVVILIDVVSRICRGFRVFVVIDFREGIGVVVVYLVVDIVWWLVGFVYGKLDCLLFIGKVVYLFLGLE